VVELFLLRPEGPPSKNGAIYVVGTGRLVGEGEESGGRWPACFRFRGWGKSHILKKLGLQHVPHIPLKLSLS
jgi:hypothetical protein